MSFAKQHLHLEIKKQNIEHKQQEILIKDRAIEMDFLFVSFKN